jgi:hypothetical protein
MNLSGAETRIFNCRPKRRVTLVPIYLDRRARSAQADLPAAKGPPPEQLGNAPNSTRVTSRSVHTAALRITGISPFHRIKTRHSLAGAAPCAPAICAASRSNPRRKACQKSKWWSAPSVTKNKESPPAHRPASLFVKRCITFGKGSTERNRLNRPSPSGFPRLVERALICRLPSEELSLPKREPKRRATVEEGSDLPDESLRRPAPRLYRTRSSAKAIRRRRGRACRSKLAVRRAGVAAARVTWQP